MSLRELHVFKRLYGVDFNYSREPACEKNV